MRPFWHDHQIHPCTWPGCSPGEIGYQECLSSLTYPSIWSAHPNNALEQLVVHWHFPVIWPFNCLKALQKFGRVFLHGYWTTRSLNSHPLPGWFPYHEASSFRHMSEKPHSYSTHLSLARLPLDKLMQIKSELRLWLKKGRTTERQILSLVGLLQHSSKAVVWELSLPGCTARLPEWRSCITSQNSTRHSTLVACFQ